MRPYCPAERPVAEFAAAESVVFVGGLVEVVELAETDASAFVASDFTGASVCWASLAFLTVFLVFFRFLSSSVVEAIEGLDLSSMMALVPGSELPLSL